MARSRATSTSTWVMIPRSEPRDSAESPNERQGRLEPAWRGRRAGRPGRGRLSVHSKIRLVRSRYEVVARVRGVPGELLTIASLNTRGIPLIGSQLAERYGA